MEGHKLAFETSKMCAYYLKKSSPKYKTGRVTLERIPINDTENFTQHFVIIPMQDAKPVWDHELGKDETEKLSGTL